MVSFEDLAEQIREGSLVRIPDDQVAWDAALDARDSDLQFENSFSAAYEVVWCAASEVDRTRSSELSRLAFFPVSEHTGQHEIASYVAEDVELLALDALTGSANRFVEQLYSAYVRAGFAVPPLP